MNNPNSIANQAAELWQQGQALEAGKLLFEALPNASRPVWAAEALALVLDQGKLQHDLFDTVLQTAREPALWNAGHRVFRSVRGEVLKLEKKSRRSSAEEFLLSSFLLAELVAKVSYNATNPVDEFDEDTGWWIEPSLRAFADHHWQETDFAAKAWQVLCHS